MNYDEILSELDRLRDGKYELYDWHGQCAKFVDRFVRHAADIRRCVEAWKLVEVEQLCLESNNQEPRKWLVSDARQQRAEGPDPITAVLACREEKNATH